MSKRHFIELADLVKMIEIRLKGGTFNVYDPNRTEVKIDVAMETIKHELARFCMNQNDRFNREHWMDYIEGKCGPNGGKHAIQR